MIQFIILLVYIYNAAMQDGSILNNGSFIYEHTTRVIERILFISLLAFTHHEIQYIIIAHIGYSLVFAALFDQTLNLVRSKSIFYLGSTAKWDIFWKSHISQYKIFVVSSCVIGTFISLNVKMIWIKLSMLLF